MRSEQRSFWMSCPKKGIMGVKTTWSHSGPLTYSIPVQISLIKGCNKVRDPPNYLDLT